MTARHRRTDTISDRYYRASPNVIAALNFLDHQRTLVPILAATNDQPGRTKGSHSDPTLTTVQTLTAIEYRRQAILDAIATSELAANVLDEALRDAYRGAIEPPTENADDKPLCRGGPPDTWGDPTCGQHVEHYRRDDGTIGFRTDGLCARHRTAKRRWEREHGDAA